jgi:hypothetical protein
VCHLASAHHIHISASTLQRSPELLISGGVSITNKVEPMLALLLQLGLQNDEIELVLLRCVSLLSCKQLLGSTWRVLAASCGPMMFNLLSMGLF